MRISLTLHFTNGSTTITDGTYSTYGCSCKHSCFSSTHFLKFRGFCHQPVLFRRQIIQGFRRPLAVIFHQQASGIAVSTVCPASTDAMIWCLVHRILRIAISSEAITSMSEDR